MGVSGKDVQLSEAARALFPYAIECKNRSRFALYQDYGQAQSNAGSDTPILVIKQNQSKPLVVIDMEDFFRIIDAHKENT
jgi:hypothetical protein